MWRYSCISAPRGDYKLAKDLSQDLTLGEPHTEKMIEVKFCTWQTNQSLSLWAAVSKAAPRSNNMEDMSESAWIRVLGSRETYD